MAIEYTLNCDKCGGLINASGVSAAEARRQATGSKTMVRLLVNRSWKEFCYGCYATSKNVVVPLSPSPVSTGDRR